MTTFSQNNFLIKVRSESTLALVWGDIKEDEGKIEGAIGRHPKNRLQMTVFEDNSRR